MLLGNPKCYWAILNRFYNGKSLPLVPLLLVYNYLESDFQVKADVLNKFFSEQCTPLCNNMVSVIILLNTSKAHGLF